MPLIGIACSIIIVRVHLYSVGKMSGSGDYRVPSMAIDCCADCGTKSRLNDQLPITVNVSQYVHRHTDRVGIENIDHSSPFI